MSGVSLILVRHAEPEQRPELPPPEWRLSAPGRIAAERLAGRLASERPVCICASSEPKAIETASIVGARLGVAVDVDPAFDEHRREAWPFEPDASAFGARVARVLADPGSSIDGAETGRDAILRFEGGLAMRRAGPLLVVTHGTVLSLWLAERAGLDAEQLWRSLRMPEAFLLNAAGHLLHRMA